MKRIRKTLAILLTALTVGAVCIGCSASAETQNKRFVADEEEYDFPPNGTAYFVTDTVTGDRFLAIRRGDGLSVAAVGKEIFIEPEPIPEPNPWTTEAEYIAKTIWGEARNCSTTEQAAVVWCILNRVDSSDPYYPDDIVSVVTQKKQFDGYDASFPIEEEYYELALDVIDRWQREKSGETDVGRVLPKEYLWFLGDGEANYFRNAYEGKFDIWDWSLTSPY